MHKQTLSNKVLKIAVATTLATAMSWMYVSPALAKSTSSTQRPTTVTAKKKLTASKSTKTVAKYEHTSSKSAAKVAKREHATPRSTTLVAHQERNTEKSADKLMDTAPVPVLTGTSNVSTMPAATLTAANAAPIVITTKDARVKPALAVAAVTKDTSTAPVARFTTLDNVATAVTMALEPTATRSVSSTPAAMPAVGPAKSEFVQQMLSNANAVNTEILRERGRMLSLQAQYDEGKVLSDSDQAWLTDLANRYHVANPNFQSSQTWTQLTQKVDVIPASLVLGQSIQESGWGASSLAKRAHNYFGQMCGSKGGCVAGTRWQSFTSMRAAVTSYMHNLNSNGAYQSLRALRFQARSANEMPNSMVLVNGLHAYSTFPNNYISAVKTVITNFKLQRYDSEVA